LIRNWLRKPHIAQWWDEQTDHPEGGLTRRDLKKFINGEKSVFTHWIASLASRPFAYLMTSDPNCPECSHLFPFLEKQGQTLTVDFFIGEEDLLGKGLSHLTLRKFAESLPQAITALILDPEASNEKAIHIYQKAGFVTVAERRLPCIL